MRKEATALSRAKVLRPILEIEEQGFPVSCALYQRPPDLIKGIPMRFCACRVDMKAREALPWQWSMTRKDKSVRQEAARFQAWQAQRDGCWRLPWFVGFDRKIGGSDNCSMSADAAGLPDRYNPEGVSGLFNRRPPDPPCLLSSGTEGRVGGWFGRVPDPETDGVVRGGALSETQDRRALRRRRCMSDLLANNWQAWAFGDLTARPQHEIRPGCTGGF